MNMIGVHRAGAQPAAGRRAGVDGRLGRRLRRAGQQCARSTPGDTFIAGAKILRQYGIGPLPGVAMMVVLISRAGYCTITARYDRAVDHATPTLFARACWPDSTRCSRWAATADAAPASFTIDADEPTPSSPNGSAPQ